MNGLKTASCLLKGRGHGEKPCDTDRGNERSVIAVAVVQGRGGVCGVTPPRLPGWMS